MLAELVDHVIGVDPDRDWITVAALDSRTSGVIATDRFPATRDGYRDAIVWADGHTVETERAWVIEGTASYGRGLTMALQHHDEFIVEFDRPTRKATKDGAKSDALDATRAAREALGRDKLNQPRAHDGIREAIRVHTVARAAAVRARTAAVNELKAFIVTAEEQLRAELRGLRTNKIVSRCSRFRDSASRPLDARCTRGVARKRREPNEPKSGVPTSVPTIKRKASSDDRDDWYRSAQGEPSTWSDGTNGEVHPGKGRRSWSVAGEEVRAL